MNHFRPAVVLLVAFSIITGVIYPLVVTGVAKLVFPHQADGSLVYQGGRLVGSELIGQPLDGPQYLLGPAVGHDPGIQRRRIQRLEPGADQPALARPWPSESRLCERPTRTARSRFPSTW